jgi:ribosomal L18e/L15-like protein
VRGKFVGIKILGDGELKHGLKVEVDKVSAAAREKIEKAGGTITLRDKEIKSHRESRETSTEESAGKALSKEASKKKTKAPAKAKRKASQKG